MKGQVHIHSSDGTGQDMVLVDEDGKKIERVSEAIIRFEAGTIATVDLTIVAPGVNVKAEIDDVTVVFPCCDAITSHSCMRTRRTT